MVHKTLFYLFTIIVSSNLFSCAKVSDEDGLKQRINDLVSAIESHKDHEIKNYLAKDFSAGKEFNKARFTLFIRYHLKRNKNILITRTNDSIKIGDTHADVTSDVLLLGANEWLPERGQRYLVESRWIKESQEWVMSRLRWQIK